MFNVEATVGGNKVYSSGQLISVANEPIRLWPFGHIGSYFLEFRFSFFGVPDSIQNENEGFGHVVTIGPPTAWTFSNIEPLLVANNSGRLVFLRFAAQRIGTNPIAWLISFMLYDGGPAA